MNARDIQRAIIVDRYRRSIVMPNYKPSKWFECDVFEQTKSGFFTEYEIKLSRSDFLADRQKRHDPIRWQGGTWLPTPLVQPTKHELLASHVEYGPRRFYFVTPEGLIAESEIPEWAGWIEVHYVEPDHPTTKPYIRLDGRRVAPSLHRKKLDPKVQEHIFSVSYYRFQSMFLHGRMDEAKTEHLPQPGARHTSPQTSSSPVGGQSDT